MVVGIIIVLNYSDTDVKIHPSYQTSSMKNLHLIRKDIDGVKWELSADEAIFPEKRENIFLKSISKIHNSFIDMEQQGRINNHQGPGPVHRREFRDQGNRTCGTDQTAERQNNK
jgi:hypothetical protein